MHLLNKIYLIGMPGSGKSTLGTQLAAKLDLRFVDLDSEIEKVEGTSIANIFKEKGEDYFRTVESRMLHTLSEKYEKFLMSTGGGAPCYHDAMDYMLDHGRVVFIDVPVETLAQRLEKGIADRPKFNKQVRVLSQIEELAKKRLPIYQKAHLTISGNDISVDDLKSILEK